MKRWRRGFLLICSILILLFGTFVWAATSPTVDDYYHLYYSRENSESALALAFTIALRRNHLSAYQMVVPEVHQELDDWMQTHQPQLCKSKAYLMLGGTGTNTGYQVIYGCENAKSALWNYAFEVDDIEIEEMKIVSWGEIIEKFN